MGAFHTHTHRCVRNLQYEKNCPRFALLFVSSFPPAHSGCTEEAPIWSPAAQNQQRVSDRAHVFRAFFFFSLAASHRSIKRLAVAYHTIVTDLYSHHRRCRCRPIRSSPKSIHIAGAQPAKRGKPPERAIAVEDKHRELRLSSFMVRPRPSSSKKKKRKDRSNWARLR